jgi:hypothetical protein
MTNGTLGNVLRQFPDINWLMIHNVDTLGATVSPEFIAKAESLNSCLNYEVIGKRVEDHGGGLARVGGKVRLIEGLAQPDDETDYKLSYYNTLTTWLNLDRWLEIIGLSRDDLINENKVLIEEAVRSIAQRVPVYVTIKDVKRRWGFGQEDVFPVAQLERLWGDLSGLDEIPSNFFVVDRQRGQQLKDPAQLDSWANDGSLEYIASLCDFKD